MNSRKILAVASVCVWLAPASSVAQQDDVTFFVIGKHGSYAQDVAGEISAVDFSFFSEIFLTANGDASDAVLTLPTGERIVFTDQRVVDGPEQDNLFLVRGEKRYPGYAALQARYPDGEYRVEFNSPSGDVDAAVLRFPGDRLPTPPTIEVRQRGEKVCGVVNPNLDLQVSWSPFESGRADSKGILDDLIFVILEDADGNRVSHSGRPFEDRPYLTYVNMSHRIDASVMLPNGIYSLSVEHAILADTHLSDAVPSMTTTAVTTRLRLETAAPGQQVRCN